MNDKLGDLLVGIAIISMPIFVTFILSLMVWVATGLTFGQSILSALGFEALLGVGLYFWIRNEVKKFSVDLDVDEEDGIL